MTLPKQAIPVTRGEVVAPHSVVELLHGTPDQLVKLAVNHLLHGANFNDPAQWQVWSYDRLKTSHGPAGET